MTAYKLPIADLKGEYVDNSLIIAGGAQIQRAWISGIVIQKRADKYLSILVDDGTGSMRVRVFEGAEEIDVELGDVVEVAGRIKEWNNRLYLIPDFIRRITLNTELLRRLEALRVRKMLKENPPKEPAPAASQPKETEKSRIEEKEVDENEQKVLEATEGEMNLSQIVEATNMKEEDVSKILDDLCDKGEVFEPKPGKYRRI